MNRFLALQYRDTYQDFLMAKAVMRSARANIYNHSMLVLTAQDRVNVLALIL